MKAEQLPKTTNQLSTGLELQQIVSNTSTQKKGVDIIWNNVTYTASTKQYHREILKGLSGICKQGELTAIMGSSGAGKTTLLNILCCRAGNTSEVKLTGDITANGHSYNPQTFANFAAYVMQEDIIMETMTVREALQFAADLKMSGTQQEKDNKVNEVIKIMRLEKCQQTLIGGAEFKGITKGEKKRTSIAFELVSDPSVIFLDEPTSGLDSFTAYNVVDVLQSYAKEQNKNIICTIHQPSSEIFMKFDRLILLVDGKFIYQGPRSQVIEYFGSFGFQCPHLSNPADYFMSIMHAESEENRKNYPIYFEHYTNELAVNVASEISNQESELKLHKFTQAPFFTQLSALTIRSFKNLQRNPMLFQARIIQAIILGVLIGIIYVELPSAEGHRDDQRLLNDYNGVLFFLAQNNHMNSMLPIVLTIPLERTIFLKEQNQKMYSVLTYFISKLVVESIMVIICPIILCSICYYMIGLNANFGNFCFFILTSIIQSFVGNAQGMFIGSLFKSPQTAIDVAPMIIIPFYLFGGLFKNARDMPDWNSWLQWVTSYRYTFEAYVYNNYEDTPFTLDPTGQLYFSLGKWKCLLILFCLFIIFQILSYFLIRANRKTLQ